MFLSVTWPPPETSRKQSRLEKDMRMQKERKEETLLLITLHVSHIQSGTYVQVLI